MRELKPAELDAAAGGRAPEFRTLIRHEIPRFEEPPVGLEYQTHDAEDHSGCRPPLPIPMHWLPPRNSEWQVF